MVTQQPIEPDPVGTFDLSTTSLPLEDTSKTVEEVILEKFPHLAGEFFFTLPEDLILLLSKDDKLASIVAISDEWALAKEGGQRVIGFRDGRPLQNSWLSSRWGVPEHRRVGLRPPSDDTPEEQLDRVLAPADPAALAYLGWLFTHREFLRHLADLEADFPWIFSARSVVGGPAFPSYPDRSYFSEASEEEYEFKACEGAKARDDLLALWRLVWMDGPAIAEPQRLDFSCTCPPGRLAGHIFVVPDVAPLPDRDLLREAIEQRLTTSRNQAPHLKEWFQIVSGDTLGKRHLDHFGRAYQLQHLMRVLNSRYGAGLRRCREALKRTFAELFSVDPRTIANDCKSISARLHPDWHTQSILECARTIRNRQVTERMAELQRILPRRDDIYGPFPMPLFGFESDPKRDDADVIAGSEEIRPEEPLS